VIVELSGPSIRETEALARLKAPDAPTPGP
jgi:hypothetical protein